MNEKAKKRAQWLLMYAPRLMRAAMNFNPEEDVPLLRAMAAEATLPQVREHLEAQADFVEKLGDVQDAAMDAIAAGNMRRGQA